MAVVSVTRLRLRSARYFFPFVWLAVRSQIQAKAAPGNLGMELRRTRGAYWTLTLWRDAAALREFMLSGAHRSAMPHLQRICDEASVGRWEQESAVLPTWEEAEQRLKIEGRMSALKFPSPAHAAGMTLGSSQ